MPYRDDDDDADEWDDDIDIDEDADVDDDEPTVPCPFCKREILEDTPRCPHCERYLSEEDFARGSKPLWVVATAIICLLIAIWLALTAF